MRGKLGLALLLGALATPLASRAQSPTVTQAMAPFVSVKAPVVALTHVEVIDGTGAPARRDQTVILRDGLITEVGDAGRMAMPEGAQVIDLTGKTVLPGLVQLHEHLWIGGLATQSATVSYPRLLLAAGVTSIRTAGSFNDYADLRLRSDIEEGLAVGPWMDLSVYMDLLGAPRLRTGEQTRKYLNFWLDSGFTSVKAYSLTEYEPLKAAIALAHARGMKVTGHLCAVTYREAADLGIDNIEHGFGMAPDFLKGGKPPLIDPPPRRDKRCAARAMHGLDDVDPEGAEARALIDHLVARKVAVTSTLVALEEVSSDIADRRGTEMLTPQLKAISDEHVAKSRQPGAGYLPRDAIRKSAIMERAFMKAGGLLVSGTDCAIVGVLPGYASVRQLEMMVEYGFTPLEAIRVATLNGAIYLGRADRIGSIAPGKQADLLIVEGDPSVDISALANPVIVFRNGLGYDPKTLRDSVKGTVGLQ